MSSRSLESAIAPGHRLLLDSSTLIAYLDGNEAASPAATVVIDDFVKSGRNPAIVSAVSVMEVLVRPLRHGAGVHHHVLNFISHTPNLTVMAVDIHVAQQAATLRAFLNFKPPDALVVASGMLAQVTFHVTNDQTWKRVHGFPNLPLSLCYLGDYGAAAQSVR